MEAQKGDLVEVENTYSPGYDDYDDYWGNFTWAGVGVIRTEVRGKTRELALARLGKTDGVVAIVEDHRDGGYCPSCTFEYVNLWIEVDGEKVWEQDFSYDSPFEGLQAWLDGADE